MKKNLFVIFVLMYVSTQTFAQKNTTENFKDFIPGAWAIHGRVGLTQFYGDLSTMNMQPMIGIGVSKRLLPYLSAQLDFNAGNLEGNKKEYFNSRFRTDLFDVSLLGRINITRLIKKEFRRLNLEGLVGIGTTRFNAVAYDLNTGIVQRYTSDASSTHTPLGSKLGSDLGENGIFYTRERSYTLGLALNYFLTQSLALTAEIRRIAINNDKLDATPDGMTTTVAQNGGVTPVRQETSYGEINDKWGFFSLGLAYHFGGRKSNVKKDSDKDGIADIEDACPTIYGTANGCPDTDHDGIADKNDACPQVAGTANGCPDADRDGIADSKDNCPNQAGTLATNGCPDSDNDGIIDSQDHCPNQAGLAGLGGCPDSDSDGIMDSQDRCPNQRGILENGGCPDKDTDGDGIIDRLDECPNEAGLVAKRGCPDVSSTDMQVIEEKFITFAQNIQFETGKSFIRKESMSELNEIVAILKQYQSVRVSIEGHTDNMGVAERNLILSQNRADAVKKYFISNGIVANRIEAAGFGQERPIATNDSIEGRQQNRRTEIRPIR